MGMNKEQKREGFLKLNYEHLKSMFLTLFTATIASLFIFIVNFNALKDNLSGIIFIIWLVIIIILACISCRKSLEAYKELKKFIALKIINSEPPQD